MKLRKLTACVMTAALVTMSLAACSADSGNSSSDTNKSNNATDGNKTQTVEKGQGEGYGVKEETVYVTTDADGSVQKILVSDWLKNPENYATLKDVTTLSDIVNVKGNEKFNVSDGNISFATTGNDIYYQGSLDKSAALPVGLKITYRLNDNDISAKELQGKSGKLSITIEYTANEKTSDGIYVPFLAVTGMLLPTDHFSNIEITNGQIVSNGDYQVALGMGVPGISESLGIDVPNTVELTADVKDFSIDMMMTVCTNKVFSEISTDDLSQINDITDMISLLSKSSAKLSDGAKELNTGLNTLKENASVLSAGIAKLNAGASQLDGGIKELSTGANTLNSGAKELNTGASQLDGGIKELNAGANQVNAGVQKLTSSMAAMTSTIQKSIADNNAKIAALKQAIGAYQTQAAAGQLSPEAAQAKIAEATQNIYALSGANEALNQILGNLTAKDANGLTLSDNLAALKNGTQALADGSAKLSQGSSSLAAGTKELLAGTTDLVAGCGELSAGASQLAAGLSELNSKIPALTDGIAKLTSGSEELSAGMSQFDESAIQKIADVYNNDFSKALDDIKKIVNAGKEYSTLTGVGDGCDGIATFIIKTNAN